LSQFKVDPRNNFEHQPFEIARFRWFLTSSRQMYMWLKRL